MRFPVLLTGGLFLAFGCSEDFTPDYRLVKSRVLALQAEPPQPPFGGSTTLRALLYLPENETPNYHWSWCPAPTVADNGFACPIDQAGFDKMLGLGPGQAPSLDLGTGETSVLTNVFPPERLAALCSEQAHATLAGNVSADGGSAPPLDAGAASTGGLWSCSSAGFPITVRMEFQTPSMAKSDPNHWAPSVFKVYLPIDGNLPGNQNPVLGALASISPLPGQPLDDTASAVLKRHLEYKLQVAMDPSTSETFRGWTRDNLGGFVKDGNNHVIGDAQEIINLKWYVEGGDLGNSDGEGGADTKYNPYEATPEAFAKALQNYWKTPKQADLTRDRARITVVGRDDRGGVGWTSAVVTLEAQP